MTDEPRIARWERRAEWPLTVAALAFLAAYAVPIIWPGVGPGTARVGGVVLTVTWAVFVVDYVARLRLARDRRRFVLGNLLDLAVILLPLLRPLRLLRLVTLLTVLNRAGAQSLRGRVVTYVTGSTLLLVLCGALAATDAERGAPGATITGFGDGLWWAVTTITTVGYGDTYPVTGTGRLVSVALMMGGIALLGVVTATLASWLVAKVSDAGEEEAVATRAQVAELAAEVRALRAELSSRTPLPPTPRREVPIRDGDLGADASGTGISTATGSPVPGQQRDES